MANELILTPDAQVSVQEAEKNFRAFLHRDSTLMQGISELTIENDDQADQAGALLKLVRDSFKEEDADRKDRAAPGEQWAKAVNDIYREHLAALKDADKKIAGALSIFFAKKAQAAAALEQKLKMDAALAEAKGEGDVSPEQIVVAPPVKTTTNVAGKVTMRDYWTAVLVDAELVPKRYWKIDEAMVQKDVENAKGQIEIPGYEIKYTPRAATGSR